MEQEPFSAESLGAGEVSVRVRIAQFLVQRYQPAPVGATLFVVQDGAEIGPGRHGRASSRFDEIDRRTDVPAG